jgi:hypothetical protein
MEFINIANGCHVCGAADHDIETEYVEVEDAPGGDRIPKLDIIITCNDCGAVRNGFLPISDMITI